MLIATFKSNIDIIKLTSLQYFPSCFIISHRGIEFRCSNINFKKQHILSLKLRPKNHSFLNFVIFCALSCVKIHSISYQLRRPWTFHQFHYFNVTIFWMNLNYRIVNFRFFSTKMFSWKLIKIKIILSKNDGK